MKKLLFLFLSFIFCCFLSACGSVNYAPGKAYMDPDVGGVAVSG